MRNNFSHGLLVLVFALLFLSVPGLAHAAGDFVVRPTKAELLVLPGESKETTIYIQNRTGARASFILGAEDIVGGLPGEPEIKLLGDVAGEYSLKNYVKSTRQEIVLLDGEERAVPVTIDLPASVRAEGLYGALTVTLVPRDTQDAGSARVYSRVAVALLVRTTESVTASGKLIDFDTADTSHLLSRGPAVFKLAYQNTGAVHLEPQGTLVLRNILGVRSESVSVGPLVVLPGSTRSGTVSLPRALHIGPYKATLTLSAASGYSESREVRLWFFPWQGFLLLLGIIILLLLGARMFRNLQARVLVVVALVCLSSSALVARAAVSTSTSYQLERDSINFAGTLSNSSNYSLEDTAGEVATGRGTSTTYILDAGYQQDDAVGISITASPDITLLPSIDGRVGGTADGSSSWTVSTNSPAGYTLSMSAANSPALRSSGSSFANYTPAGATPDYSWSVSSASSEFGFTPEGADITSTYKDNGTACAAGASDTSSVCWDSVTLATKTIASRAVANAPSGTATTLRFRAEAGSIADQAAGSYSAVITLTAMAI